MSKNEIIKIDVVGTVMPVAVENKTDVVKVADEEMNFSSIEIGNTTGISDLGQYTNLQSKELAKSFENIEKFKKAVRISVIGIGGELAKINATKSYKKDFPKMTFAKFITDVIGLKKATAYRYMGVYAMCADVTGKPIPELEMLSDSQLRALYESGATKEQAIEIAKDITRDTTKDEIRLLCEKSQNETETETETETEAETETETETETEKFIIFKSNMKNASPLKVPEKVVNDTKKLKAYLKDNIKPFSKGVTVYDCIKGGNIDYIIKHDETMSSVMIYFNFHTPYTKSSKEFWDKVETKTENENK